MLKLTGIHKEYQAGTQKVEALHGVDLTLRKNEFVAILGPSGCGKTTLLNIIGGLDRYTSGEMSVNGKSTRDFSDADWDAYRNRSVGFVFQSYNLIPHQSVLSNVELALTLSGVSKSERTRRAREALEKVGLGDQIKKRPNQMSGGQMQRVAIARALVNDPEILLADEPTGALDSETSVQIMDLLREVARDRLVVMVTHNPDLADRYANRIIRLLDGRVISDSAPCEEDDVANRDQSRLKKPSLTMRTALGLSLNNLLTKKTRTLLVSFAGSIGIIGIALILSISNGVKSYISQVERDTLSSYPITIEQESVNSAGMLAAFASTAETIMQADPVPEGSIRSNNAMAQILNTMMREVTSNDLASLKTWMDGNTELHSLVSDIQYSYAAPVSLYRQVDGDWRHVNPSTIMQSMYGMTDEMFASMSAMSSSYSLDLWQEIIGGEELLKGQYDLLAGRWPSGPSEAVLVVSENRTVNELTLYALGIRDQSEANDVMKRLMNGEDLNDEATTFTYDDVLGMTFYLTLPTDFYEATDTGFVPVADEISVIENGLPVRITAVIRPSADAISTSLRPGSIGYASALKDYIVKGIADSPIVKAQLAQPDTDVFTGLPFASARVPGEPTPAQKALLSSFDSDPQLASWIQDYALPEDHSQYSNATLSGNLTLLSYNRPDTPTSISIYPKSFESKERVIALIDGYNAEMEASGNEAGKIEYTDYVGLLMSSVSTIVDAITYVLIAFVAISLVVSSIMIGIITYISVLERTREIGVLRSIGASKRDISKVFNAETLIVGLAAGAMGILISWLLTFPINAIVGSLADISQVAKLPVSGAVALVIISMALTLVAGLIPSRIAARKDPVVALRTE